MIEDLDHDLPGALTEKNEGVSSCSAVGSMFQTRQDCSSLASSVSFHFTTENVAWGFDRYGGREGRREGLKEGG